MTAAQCQGCVCMHGQWPVSVACNENMAGQPLFCRDSLVVSAFHLVTPATISLSPAVSACHLSCVLCRAVWRSLCAQPSSSTTAMP